MGVSYSSSDRVSGISWAYPPGGVDVCACLCDVVTGLFDYDNGEDHRNGRRGLDVGGSLTGAGPACRGDG